MSGYSVMHCDDNRSSLLYHRGQLEQEQDMQVQDSVHVYGVLSPEARHLAKKTAMHVVLIGCTFFTLTALAYSLTDSSVIPIVLSKLNDISSFFS